jgi:hypothetical protein
MKEILKKILPTKIANRLRLLKLVFSKKLNYAQDCLYTTVKTDFMHDKLFIESYNKGRVLMPDSWGDYQFHWRAYVLCWSASQAKNLEGDFVECGVNTGMFSKMIINFTQFEKSKKDYYLLDTFNGMSEKYSSPEEIQRSVDMGYSDDIYEEVKETFKGLDYVKIIKGAVPETLPLVLSEKISFLSIDMNCALPEKEALEFFWDKIVKGGIILIDDYGFPGHDDQKKLHDNFAKEKGILILPLPTGQGMIIK